MGEGGILGLYGVIAQGLGQLGDAPVIVGILQCLGNGLVVLVAGDVANLVFPILGGGHQEGHHPAHRVDARSVVLRRAQAGAEGFLHVEVALPLGVGIGYERGGVIAYHRARVVGGQFPLGENAALPLLDQQRADEGLVLLRTDEGHQRMEGTEGVPQGEGRIDGIGYIALMNLPVHAAVTSVRIGEEVGLYAGVVEGGIEDGALVGIVRLNVYAGQIVVPRLPGRATHSVEVPIRNVRLHIAPRAFHINGRDAHLDQHLFAAGGGKLQQGLAHCLAGTSVLWRD